MKKKVLLVSPYPKESVQGLLERYDVYYPEKTLSNEQIMELLPQFDAVLSSFIRPLTAQHIARGEKLQIIANYGVGFNNIDIEAATKQGIVVTNTPDPVTAPTADTAMGLLLDVSRAISLCDRNLRGGADFSTLSKTYGRSLDRKTIGIIGMGRIGQAVAKRAKAFDMKVVYYKRNRLSEVQEREIGATYLPMQELLSQADYVSLHTPLDSTTTHLITYKELSCMKPSAFIINTARGPVIKEEDLVRALEEKVIAGAGLDVFEHEPKISPSLLSMDQVVLTPHIGTSTPEARFDIGVCASNNIIYFFEGDLTLLNRVN